jgi:hypothetical protein
MSTLNTFSHEICFKVTLKRIQRGYGGKGLSNITVDTFIQDAIVDFLKLQTASAGF